MDFKGKRNRISKPQADMFHSAALAPSTNTPALLPGQQTTITVSPPKILPTNLEISIKEALSQCWLHI